MEIATAVAFRRGAFALASDRRWNLRLGPDLSWNHGWARVGTGLGGRRRPVRELPDFGFNVNRDFGTLDDRITRGGVMARTSPGLSGFAFLSTDNRSPYTVRASVSGSQTEAGDWRNSINLNFGLHPGSNYDVQAGPNFSRGRSTAFLTVLGRLEHRLDVNDPEKKTQA